ncbi:MFS transporter [Streptomyces sp. Ag109_O5-1]|uniref:MFS transporter n=1 Tax=Streptomyces sp. Ag109_O5-1 TaxID=1938851 RepID=UPI000F50150A|nr:MFS transporter [Streptomyces sp. Ag109_O5-1]RPE40713.1 MFS transporter [Streptomyces sp. Ag109_O5-1]
MTMTDQAADTGASPQAAKLGGRAAGLLAVLCAAFFLDALDTSMVAVALPTIQHALDMSLSQLQWVVSGYVLGFGGFLLLGGRAADLLGRRRVFLVALVAFFLMSGLGGIAGSGEILIASRFLKGIAAGFTAPAGLAIILTSFPEGPVRNRALAIYSSTGSAGFTFGLISGGLLSEAGWRWVFIMPAIVAGLILLAAPRLIPADRRGEGRRQKMDIPGAATVTIAMLLLVYTLTEAPAAGWASARTIGSLAGVALLLTAFVLIERRHHSPHLPLSLLASWPRVRANLGAMAFVGGWASAQFMATLYMQETRGWSALATAAAFWPCGVLGLFVAPRIEKMIGRHGVQRVLVLGLLLTVAAYLLILPIGMHSGYWTALFPTFALIGIAFALCFSTLSITATTGIAPDQQGVASGLFQTSAQFGTALLVAVTTAVSQAATTPGSPAGALRGYHAGLLVPLIAVTAVLLLTLPAALRKTAPAPAQ